MHPSGCLARRVFRPACTALLLAGYGAILALCGADLAAGVRFWLAAVFWLWLPGRALAARLAPRRISLHTARARAAGPAGAPAHLIVIGTCISHEESNSNKLNDQVLR